MLLLVQEKRLKQKMQDWIAQALIATNGAPLSISEHEAIVSQIKCEAAEAHASVMESKNTYSKCMFLFYMQVLSSFILHV